MQNKEVKKQIYELLDSFDFELVYKTMKFLNWKWFNYDSVDEVPSIANLVLTAEGLLNEAYDNCKKSDSEIVVIGTGGFKAEYDVGAGFKLEFVLESFHVC